MKKFWLQIAATLIAAAICGNVAVLWSLNGRVGRIEARLGIGATAQTAGTLDPAHTVKAPYNSNARDLASGF
jgi:hypothetical protein